MHQDTAHIYIIDEIFSLLASDSGGCPDRARRCAHLRRTAALAQREGAGPALIAAALLHQIGGLLPGEAAAEEESPVMAAAWLTRAFDETVTRPIAMQIEVWRYLYATEPRYLAALDAEARASLHARGGVMDVPECEIFERDPAFAAALRLHDWSSRALILQGAPRLEQFRPAVEQALRASLGSAFPAHCASTGAESLRQAMH